MKIAVLKFSLACLVLTFCLASIPRHEESRSPEIVIFSHAEQEEISISHLSMEQSRNPEVILIAHKSSEKIEEETTNYECWGSQEERRRFIRVAVAFSGTPYRRGGITAQGMDCSGFTYMVYRLFGVQLPRTVANQYLIGRRIDRNDLEEGDLVFFNGTEKPMHVGIYLGDGKFIHASMAAKQIRTDFLDTPWQFKHFIAAVRVRELMAPREKR
jgi:hypothetical protein